jgi:hypothetical protein
MKMFCSFQRGEAAACKIFTSKEDLGFLLQEKEEKNMEEIGKEKKRMSQKWE